ncbi:MAG TPA: TadE/TadG family type IV pilus assembly protein [Candidatus Limnocylindria bacterium]
MSDQVVSRPISDSATRSRRGQSLVEFALVLPMLLVLLLGVADFGRVFNAGITLEAVARDAAEVGALQRLRDKPDFSDPSQHPAYYTALHQLIARTACAESDQLALSPEQVDATDCPRLTAIRACVHDNLDTQCGGPIPGFDGAVPAECTDIAPGTAPPWSNYSGGETNSHFVEVRACYHFTTLLNLQVSLPFEAGLNLGDVYLQRTRSFVLDCPPPPALVSTC